MDLSLSAAEKAFAQDVRDWLTRNTEQPDPTPSPEESMAWGRRWQAKLAEARMVAISWPESLGGRDATPVEVALYNMEYARAGAPQPVNRVGINLAGPTLLAHGTPEQQVRWLPSILDASEIWCQLFSEPGAGSGPGLAADHSRGGRRRVAGHRREGVDLLRRVLQMGDRPRAHRQRR